MDIYAINIEDLNKSNFDYKLYNHILSEQILLKANNYRYYQDSVRTVIGELLVHYLYIKNYKSSSSPLTILRNNYGKPYCNNSDFHFNISHAGNWVIAIVDTQPVGIDIELVSDIDYKSVISIFHSIEGYGLEKATNKKDFFFTLWTIKESVIKNIGQGLSIPLDSFYTLLNGDQATVHFDNNDFENDQYYVKVFEFCPQYKVAACALHNNFPEAINILEPSKFLPFLLESNGIS
ncbi:4'-phosphopantetheinyl transferase family protein [Lysinibacillus xylanilyticus]|uniref:4'-phosphopantetheinyl transferase family protein n=1 Tax=Lysinibacillus xylanilyticus TaxID=582475 RepID=UPI00382BACE3